MEMKTYITDINQLDLNKSYTYADYLTWRFDEMVEIIKGKIFKMSPGPNTFHQTVSMNVSRIFSTHLYKSNRKPFAVPTDVRLVTKSRADEDIISVVQPDFFVVCDPAKMDSRGCLGSPEFIIEIISPSTSAKDLKIKYNLYEEAGVNEYWIIHPGDQYIQAYHLENGKYEHSGIYAEEAKIPVQILPGQELAVEDIFER